MINNSVYDGDGDETKKSTPQIELSCVSSSQQQIDSHDSSPENVFEQVGTGTLLESTDLNHKEEDALESRSLLEEAAPFMQQKKPKDLNCLQELSQQKGTSTLHVCKYDEHQIYLQQHQRKDSASSEVAALLCISGRSSRISSICSQGSAISHLSAASGISRTPSPHRMLLETSFCGLKPVNNLVDSKMGKLLESPAVTSLEQILLSRTQDPTQAIFAEGVKVELQANGKNESTTFPLPNGNDSLSSINMFQSGEQINQRDIRPGQIIIGKTDSGTDYIRINLKPHHMYDDRGIASNEKVVEAPNTLAPIFALKQKKPIFLSLPPKLMTEKQGIWNTRNVYNCDISPNEAKENQSPSPVVSSASRKSSFSSLFRFGGKDSPDLSKERSRSKCKERATIQTITSTPSKPMSLLAMLKPGKRASSAGCGRPKSSIASSPTEACATYYTSSPSPASTMSHLNISSNNRLRYYDEPKEGIIHIPLHTPPEEKDIQKVFQDIQNLNTTPIKPLYTPITVSDLAIAAAALKPVPLRSQETTIGTLMKESRQLNQMQGEENLDVIYTLSKEYNKENDIIFRNIPRDFSKLSEKIVNSIELTDNLVDNKLQKNAEAKLCRLPSTDSSISGVEVKVVETKATINSNAIPQSDALHAKEKCKLLFATRLGSGSQGDVFSTQFSISKTESISSRMSEEPGVENFAEQGNIIRCSDVDIEGATVKKRSTLEKNVEKTISSNEISTEQFQDKKLNTSTWEMGESNNGNVERNITLSYSQSYNTCSPLENKVNLDWTYNKNSKFLGDFEGSQEYLNILSKLKTSTKNQFQHSPINEQNTAPNYLSSELLLIESTPLPSSNLEINRSNFRSFNTSEGSLPQLLGEPCTQTPQELPQDTPCTKKTKGERESPIPTEVSSKKDQKQSIQSSKSKKDSDVGNSVAGDTRDYHPTNSMPSAHIYKSVHTYNKHEPESTELVTQESFEDDLPYIPTTLPEERSQGVSLIPIKERAHIDLKTCPLERPRSTTPLNPSQLEEYLIKISEQPTFSTLNGSMLTRGDKLRISLPKRGSKNYERQGVMSPRKFGKNNEKSWLEFAEQGLRAAGNLEQKTGHNVSQKINENNQSVKIVAKFKEQTKKSQTCSQRKLSGHWIDFDNIPEKRKPPKRITTLPKDNVTTTERSQVISQTNATSQKLRSSTDKIFYNYVKPEHCHCECHEMYKKNDAPNGVYTKITILPASVPLLQQDDNMMPLIGQKSNESNLLPTYNNYIHDECRMSPQHLNTTPGSPQHNDTQTAMANSQLPHK